MYNFKKFAGVRLFVIGDVMLDKYLTGDVTRISPEAPVPVVNLKSTTLTAGGAANVAANAVGLGAAVYLMGVIGEDEEGRIFPKVLDECRVSSENLIKVEGHQTTLKTRIIAHNQQVVRVDQEKLVSLTEGQEEHVWQKAEELTAEADTVVISDYNKGFLTERLLKRLITTAKESGKMVLVDPKGRDYTKYEGATILTPNKFEVSEVCGGVDPRDERSLVAAGSALRERLGLEALLITRGEEGMTLLEKGREPRNLGATARKVYDVTGAGDTVIAALSAAIAAGESFHAAARIANAAAGQVVSELGTTVINIEKLSAALENLTQELKAPKS